MNKKKRSQRRTVQTMTWKEMLPFFCKGVSLAVIILMSLLFFMAMAISQGVFLQDNMVGLVLVCLVVASLVGGLFILQNVRCSGLLVGLIIGISLYLVLVFVGYLFYGEVSFGKTGLEILLACLSGGVVSKIFMKKKSKNY